MNNVILPNLNGKFIFSGNISQINVSGEPGKQYGYLSVARDNGYKDNEGKWVKKPEFFKVNLKSYFLNKVRVPLNVGDTVVLEVELANETYTPKGADKPKTQMVLEAKKLVQYMDKATKQKLFGASSQSGFNPQGAQQQAPQEPQQPQPMEYVPSEFGGGSNVDDSGYQRMPG